MHQKSNSTFAVNKAMVVAQGKVHHWAKNDLTIVIRVFDGSVLNSV
jgi:hypothetical protein